eukprot:251864-Pyramimonas_sp.AAC.1
MVRISNIAPERALISYPALVSQRHQADASSVVDWKGSRGPLSRVGLCLRKAGWSAPEACSWIDHHRNRTDISLVSPRMLQEWLEAGLQRQAELALGRKLGFPPGHRATLDVVRDNMVPRVKSFTRQQQPLRTCAACDASLTEQRAKDAGYLSCGRCECGQIDTPHHRIYTCTRPDVQAARDLACEDIPIESLQGAFQ